VAVEKLAHHESAEIGLRQQALQTIFSSLLDVFSCVQIFVFIQKNWLFRQPQGASPCISDSGLLVIGSQTGYLKSIDEEWLGGLDSNQDNQIQNLMYCQLYDLPAGDNKKGRSRDPHILY
jgi:hypothetical protein